MPPLLPDGPLADGKRERGEAARLADATQEHSELVRALIQTVQRAVQIMRQDRLLHRSLWTLCRAWVAQRLFPDVFEEEHIEHMTIAHVVPKTTVEAIEVLIEVDSRLYISVNELSNRVLQLFETWHDERGEQKDIRANEASVVTWIASKMQANQVLSHLVTLVVGAILYWLAQQFGIPMHGGATP